MWVTIFAITLDTKFICFFARHLLVIKLESLITYREDLWPLLAPCPYPQGSFKWMVIDLSSIRDRLQIQQELEIKRTAINQLQENTFCPFWRGSCSTWSLGFLAWTGLMPITRKKIILLPLLQIHSNWFGIHKEINKYISSYLSSRC